MKFFILSNITPNERSQEAFYGSTVEKCVDFIIRNQNYTKLPFSWRIFEAKIDNDDYFKIIGDYNRDGEKVQGYICDEDET